jgi:hypothetical protein
VEHLALLVPLVLVGALAGTAAAALIGPLLVRSDVGAAPVPRAVVAWPWTSELVLVAGLLLATAAAAAALAASLVRRSDAARPEGDER